MIKSNFLSKFNGIFFMTSVTNFDEHFVILTMEFGKYFNIFSFIWKLHVPSSLQIASYSVSKVENLWFFWKLVDFLLCNAENSWVVPTERTLTNWNICPIFEWKKSFWHSICGLNFWRKKLEKFKFFYKKCEGLLNVWAIWAPMFCTSKVRFQILGFAHTFNRKMVTKNYRYTNIEMLFIYNCTSSAQLIGTAKNILLCWPECGIHSRKRHITCCCTMATIMMIKCFEKSVVAQVVWYHILHTGKDANEPVW